MADLFSIFGSKISAAYEVAKRFGNSELLLQISDLQMDLANIKSDYADLLNTNTELKTKIADLESRLENKNRGGGSITSVPVVRN